MTLSVIFNGHELNEFLGVTSDFERGIGTERENNLLEVGSSNFKQYQGYRLKENRIPMPFVIRYNLTEKRRELASILNVDEPKKLIFGDEPDKYYLAVPTGKVGLSENNFLGKGEIIWEVPDGRAHAVEEKTFKNEPETTKVIVSDFNTPPKILGSKKENGNVAMRFVGEPFPTNPNSSTREYDTQAAYDAIKVSDGTLSTQTATTAASGFTPWHIISFNVIWILEQDSPQIFKNASTIAEKVDIAKKAVVGIAPTAFGKGTGPSGNRLNAQVWVGSAWTGTSPNNSNNVAQVGFYQANPAIAPLYIHSDGFCHLLVYGEASSATVASTASIDYARIELTVKVPPSNYIDVENTGTYPVFPRMNVEMNGDNGVVGLFTEEGAIIQIGNPDEIDGVPYQKQEMVIDERWNGTSMPANWSKNTGKIRYTTYVANGQQNIVKGEWDFTTDADAVRPSYSGNLEPVWAGPTLHRDIPKNSNGSNTANFTYKNRFTFDAINRTVGRIELNLQSGDDIPLSFVMRDSSTSNAEIRYEIWIQGKRYIDKALDRTKFKSGFFQVEINKYDGKIEFKIVDIKAISNEIVTGSSVEIQSWYVSGMEDVPITSLTTWIHRFQNESWTGINLTDTKFTWLNVDKWNDLANTFSKGDMLSIDTSSATISVNGVQSTVLGALGNEWDKFEIPPGKHKIYVMVSSWAEAPEVSLSIREAYL